MKHHRTLLIVVVTVMSLCMLAVAQNTAQPAAQKPADQMDHSTAPQPGAKPPLTEAQKAFNKLKTLDGPWEGHMKIIPAMPEMDGKPARVTFRVVSRGHTLMHDLKPSGIPDEPVTMFVVDADRLLATHYCDGDNRPRMTGKMSPDGKTVEFEFLDISGKMGVGHMHHALFTFIDDDHHTEEWTYMMPGDKPARVVFDFQRVKDGSGGAGK